MKTRTPRAPFQFSTIKIESLLPLLLVGLAFLAQALIGCNDGGSELEHTDRHPATSSGTGGGTNSGVIDDVGAGGGSSNTLTPPNGSGGNENTNQGCQHIPYKWELISYNGCMTSPRMSGLIQDQLDGTPLESFFTGTDFAKTTDGPLAGQAFVLTKPSANECGPASLAMVSNSGTVDVKVFRDAQGDPEEVEFYLLNPSLMDEVWMDTHDGSAPSEDVYYAQNFSNLMLQVFECYKNIDCELISNLATRGQSLPPNIVTPQAIASEVSASGSFCGRMLLVAKSRP